jgi:hypothetical protein
MSRSPMIGASGFVHIAAASACVILRRMAAESDSPQPRAVPKSLTERIVAAVTDMIKIGDRLLEPNQLQRYKINCYFPKEKRGIFGL